MALLQKRLDLEYERHHDLRKANLVRDAVEVLEDAAVDLLQDRVLETVLNQLRLGDLEATAEIERLHRQLGSLLVEIVLVKDVQVVRQHRDELLRLAGYSNELGAEVEPEGVVLGGVDEANSAANDLHRQKKEQT